MVIMRGVYRTHTGLGAGAKANHSCDSEVRSHGPTLHVARDKRRLWRLRCFYRSSRQSRRANAVGRLRLMKLEKIRECFDLARTPETASFHNVMNFAHGTMPGSYERLLQIAEALLDGRTQWAQELAASEFPVVLPHPHPATET